MSSVPQELLGTWSRRSTSINPPKYAIAYTFFSDGHYQFDAILEPSLGVQEQRQQIIGDLTVSGSNLLLQPKDKFVDGQRTQNNLQEERYGWEIDNSLAYGGVVVLKLIGTTEIVSGSATFYKNV